MSGLCAIYSLDIPDAMAPVCADLLPGDSPCACVAAAPNVYTLVLPYNVWRIH